MKPCTDTQCSVHRTNIQTIRMIFNAMMVYQYSHVEYTHYTKMAHDLMLSHFTARVLDDEPATIVEQAARAGYLWREDARRYVEGM